MRNRPLPGYHRQSPTDGTPDDGVGAFNHRLLLVFVLILTAFAFIAGRLAWIQTTLADDYASSFNFTRVEYEVIPARDGRILTDDTVLATDVARYAVEAHYRWLQAPADDNWVTRRARLSIPQSERRNIARLTAAKQSVLSDRDEMWERLATISGVSRATLGERSRRIQDRVERIAESVNRRRGEREAEQTEATTGWADRLRRQLGSPPQRTSLAPIIVQEELDYHPLVAGVPLEVAAEIRAHPELYPGLRIRETTARVYPQKTLAAHLVGSRSRDAAKTDTHRAGQSGVERSYDGRLSGIDGRRKVTYNRRGEVIVSEVVREPTSGRDVVLTLDTALQRSAEKLLDKALSGAGLSDDVDEESEPRPVPTGGCIIVMDTQSGEVAAIASAPRFDLNLLSNPDEQWQATLNDPRHPLFPRSVQMTVPPGSVYKVLTAVAMMAGANLDEHAHFHCQGYLNRPDRHRCAIYRRYGVGHGQVDLRSALAQSCNVYFFNAARHMGAQPMVDWSRRFGFGQPTGIDVPFERRGNLPAPPTAGGRGQRWYSGDTLGLAIGQSRLTVTPIQIVRMMAAIANGGHLVTPRVVAESGSLAASADSSESWSARPRRRIHGLLPDVIEEVRHGLFSAVHDPAGTAYDSVRHTAVSIAGKTGTAEVGGGRVDHAWFSGYVPASRPRFAFVVMLEHGGSGGKAAGPVAHQLVDAMLRHGLLPTANVVRR